MPIKRIAPRDFDESADAAIEDDVIADLASSKSRKGKRVGEPKNGEMANALRAAADELWPLPLRTLCVHCG